MQNQPLIRTMPFRFTGNASEYFRIWIVNIFLSIVTLGIYSAWAKVRTLRYFYGNTWLDENNFSYLADPVKILKGRLIAVTALVIYFFSWEIFPEAGFWMLALGVLLFPAIMVMAMSFQLNNSAYRNIRFAFTKNFRKVYTMFAIPVLLILGLTWLGYSLLESSDFLATLSEAEETEFRKEDLLPTVFIFSLLPFLPYLDYLRSRFIVEHTRYGESQAHFTGTGWKFYAIFLIAFAAFSVVMTVASIGLVMVMAAFGFMAEESENIEEGAMVVVLIFTVVIYGLSFIFSAYIRAARTNMIFNSTFFGEDTFISKLQTFPIAWLYLSNAIAMICSVGLLIPWAQIRMARYVAEHTEFESRTLDNIPAAADSKQSALGEEFGDAFDIDLGL